MADVRTLLAASLESEAARLTPVMLDETSLVPADACSTLRAISWVAAPCSSTAAAIVAAIWSMSLMVLPMALMACAACWVHPWIAPI